MKPDSIDDPVEAWRTDGHGNWYGVARLATTGGLGVPVTEMIRCIAEPPHPVTWQSERPTAGTWWVSLRPDKRDKEDKATVYGVIVSKSGEVKTEDGCEYFPLHWHLFDGALWLKRETPADPFEGGGR